MSFSVRFEIDTKLNIYIYPSQSIVFNYFIFSMINVDNRKINVSMSVISGTKRKKKFVDDDVGISFSLSCSLKLSDSVYDDPARRK